MNKTTKILIFSLIILPLIILAGQKAYQLEGPKEINKVPKRIVSLAPSITETLFAIGLNEEIVGVTRFCTYPPQALNKPKIGGFSDVNYEAILRKKPDLVVIPYDKFDNISSLKRIGLPVAPINNRSLSGLLNSIEELGEITGKTEEAKKLVENLNKSLEKAKNNSKNNNLKVLFVIMRSYEGLSDISELQAVGRDGFYDDLIKIAGAKNAYEGHLSFPKLSKEAIIILNPDIIIDVIPPHEDSEKAKENWQNLKNIKALKNNKLLILKHEAATVPGPRFPEVLEQLTHIINL